MLFDQFATMTQAAISGMGITLLPAFLFQDELDKGKLVQAIDLKAKNDGANYLCWPDAHSEQPSLVAFRNWNMSEAKLEKV